MKHKLTTKIDHTPGDIKKVSHLHLSKSEIWQGLEQSVLDDIYQNIEIEHYERRKLIFTPGTVSGKVYILREGEVLLYRKDGEEKAIISTVRPCDLFGDICFRDHCKHGSFAETTAPSIVGKISCKTFLEFVQKNPQISLNLLRHYCQRVMELEDQVNDFITKDAKSLIISHLHRLAVKHGIAEGDDSVKIQVKLTHDKLGKMLGLRRETVSKIISDLKKQGVLESEFQYFIISKSLFEKHSNICPTS